MEQNLPPLPPVIFENGLYYELRGEQYYPCLLPPDWDRKDRRSEPASSILPLIESPAFPYGFDLYASAF